jgi:transposase
MRGRPGVHHPRSGRRASRPEHPDHSAGSQIAGQLAAHADGHIFTSLPRSGTARAARLFTEIGDCRARFPGPQSLICLAGAAPSTRQPGKHKTVTFRCQQAAM